MEYDAALKEKANTQAERIIELEASVDVLTVLTYTTDYAARVVATGTNKKLNNTKAMMNQLADSVTAQEATMSALSNKMNGGSSGTGKNTDKKKARSGLHVCAHCKRIVYHKDGNCLELDMNKTKR